MTIRAEQEITLTRVDDGQDGTVALTLETPYSVENGIATFNAMVYRAGVPITNNFDASCFVWYKKTEDYDIYPDGKIPLGTGKSISIPSDSMNYGGVIRCEFLYQQTVYLLDHNGNNLITNDGNKLIAYV